MDTSIPFTRREPGFELHFELRFPSLFNEGRGLAFPCDDHGQVDLASLPHRARDNYLLAKTLIGREFMTPRMQATLRH